MSTEPRGGDGSRRHALDLIDFLGAYDRLRNPPIRDIAEFRMFRLRSTDLPEHPAVTIRPTAESWLVVDFLELPPAPDVPEEIHPLLADPDALSAGHRPELIPVPEIPRDEDQSDDDWAEEVDQARGEWAEHTAPAEEWIDDVWSPWATEHHVVAQVKTLHREFFEARERLRLERDSIELVWGFGNVGWSSPQGHIQHPLISVPVEIDVDAQTEGIVVRQTGAPEVENRFLAGIDLHDATGYQSLRNTLIETGLDPWLDDDLDALLQRLTRAVDDEGIVMQGIPHGAGPHPRTDRGWTLYLRRRVSDSQGFLDAMRQLYLADVPVPEPLRALLTDGAFTGTEASDADISTTDLLLPLAANEEQERILRKVQVNAGVTVQGPPGTGKSHTIANLISHYVAHGQRVLVVAEKEQALKVLADKVPEGIRHLTVSVLGADDEGRRRLESSISQIQSGVTALDPRFADAEIGRLTTLVDAIDRDIAVTTTTMLRARSAEIATLRGTWPTGESPTPQAAAAWLADNAVLDYIPDAIGPDVPLPLGSRDLGDLIALSTQVGAGLAQAAVHGLPPVSDLPSTSDLRQWFGEIDRLTEVAERALTGSTHTGPIVGVDPTRLRDLVAVLRSERDQLTHTLASWRRTIAVATDPFVVGEWVRFHDNLVTLREEAWELRAALRAHDVRIPHPTPPDFVAHLTAARDRLSDGGRLGMFARDGKRAVEQCSVDGHLPNSTDDVALCLQQVELHRVRTTIATRWTNQTTPLGADALPGFPEEGLHAALNDLNATLGARVRWQELSERLQAVGRPAGGTPTAESLDAHLRWCADAFALDELANRRARIDTLATDLDRCGRTANASPLWSELHRALSTRDVDHWDRTRDQVQSLTSVAPRARRLLDLHSTLAAAAPRWADQIRANPHAAGDPERLALAWSWRQLSSWVQQITDLPAPHMLQRRLDELSTERRKTVVELVTQRAWRRLKDNIGRREHEALQSYVYAVKRYGKTGGKFAQRWINEMRLALDNAKTAVPVWIMPTSRALNSSQPSAVPPFDVLIIDEASQIGFGALPLLSLARTAIVVGDDKQTSPENVGLDRQSIFTLQDDYLNGIANYRNLFDPDKSLYDLAVQKFSASVMLTEHFRSLPEIISFSNGLAYDGKIVPLRDRPPRPDWVPLGYVRVLDGYRKGDLNEPEAHQVIELITKMVRDTAYEGMTFGVISMLGTTQSKFIWERLYDELGPEIMEERQIRCGEAANFQGDERDVMVLSMVVDNVTRFGAMTSERDLRRINVAASRARNQMWVVASVDADRFSTGDFRAALVRHVQDAGTLGAETHDPFALCDSQFERSVLRMVLARGYRNITPQRRVGRYKIDFVIEGPNARLAVECDGDRWHGEDVWHADRSRQQVLERAGWTFERIRGSAFYRNPAVAMQPVWDRLEQLGIPTGSDWMVTTPRSRRMEVSGTPDVTGDALENLEPGIADQNDHPLSDQVTVPDTPSRSAGESSTGGESSAGSGWTVPAAPLAVAPWLVDLDYSKYIPAAESSQPSVVEPPASRCVETAMRPSPSTATAGSDISDQDAGPFALTPYQEWVIRPLPPVDAASDDAVILGLLDIVRDEGPVRAMRAFQLYVRASGGSRVGPDIRRSLERITMKALRRGDLHQLKDRRVGTADKTLHLFDQDPIQPRTLGPRDFYDVPRSEIRTVINGLELAGGIWGEDLKRAVLQVYGLKSLTSKADLFLGECVTDTWEV